MIHKPRLSRIEVNVGLEMSAHNRIAYNVPITFYDMPEI